MQGEVEHSVRTLRTILAGDVVGYSRHVGEAEEETLSSLLKHRQVIDGLIASRGGRIFTTAGDSVLAEFESPVEAVRCALEIQESVRGLHRSQAVPRPLQFRIGIHAGDILRNGNNLLGDAVNIAARLESIAEPGSVFISREVKDFIEAKLAVHFRFRGNEMLKNISRPIETYQISSGPAPLGQRMLRVFKRYWMRVTAVFAPVLFAYLFLAYDGVGLIRNGVGYRVAPINTVLQREPPAGSLAPGQKVLIDDGSCLAGQIKEASGGNQSLNLPRTYRCIQKAQ